MWLQTSDFFFHLSISVHAELNFHLLLCGSHGKAAKVRWHWIHKMNFGGTKMSCVVVIAPLDAVVTFIIAISILLLRCLRHIEHHSRWVPLSPLISSHSIGFPGHSHCLSNLKKVHRKGSLMSQRPKQQRSYRIYKHCESWRCSCLVAQGEKKALWGCCSLKVTVRAKENLRMGSSSQNTTRSTK